jgi:hypothetical protein
MTVLAEIMDGIAEEGEIVVLVVPEFLERNAVEAQETALGTYPQEIVSVLADPVDLGVGESQFRGV